MSTERSHSFGFPALPGASLLVLLLAGSCVNTAALDRILDAQCAWAARCEPGETPNCRTGLFFGLGSPILETEISLGSNLTSATTPPPRGDLWSPAALLASVRAGRVQLDAAQVDACLAGRSAMSCPESVNADVLHACAAMYIGTVPRGGHCIVDEACPVGDQCEVLDAGAGPCGGSCAPLLPGQCVVEESCQSNELCTGRCVPVTPPGGQGEPCGNAVPCDDGLLCQLAACDTGGFGSICEPPQEAGEPCVTPLSCDNDGGRGEGWNDCATGLTCVGLEVTPGGVCGTQALDGMPCTYVDGCVRGDYCSSGTCVPLPSSGPCVAGLGWCASDAFCSGWSESDAGTCTPLFPIGTPCDDNTECAAPNACVAETDGSASCEPVQEQQVIDCTP